MPRGPCCASGLPLTKIKWQSAHHNLVDAMMRLEAALTPFIGDAPASFSLTLLKIPRQHPAQLYSVHT
jgi:hypothetical protein